MVAGTLDFYRRFYAGEFKEEPEATAEQSDASYTPDDDDDYNDEEV